MPGFPTLETVVTSYPSVKGSVMSAVCPEYSRVKVEGMSLTLSANPDWNRASRLLIMVLIGVRAVIISLTKPWQFVDFILFALFTIIVVWEVLRLRNYSTMRFDMVTRLIVIEEAQTLRRPVAWEGPFGQIDWVEMADGGPLFDAFHIRWKDSSSPPIWVFLRREQNDATLGQVRELLSEARLRMVDVPIVEPMAADV